MPSLAFVLSPVPKTPTKAKIPMRKRAGWGSRLSRLFRGRGWRRTPTRTVSRACILGEHGVALDVVPDAVGVRHQPDAGRGWCAGAG